jgi:nitroimidazol reductase NimA-like FMN-containing flavoprotein (pyridoxamine 5'-phosphate oxidase superfamily)
MIDLRRKEKEIKSEQELEEILFKAKTITIAMCRDNQPYLVTLSHGYDHANKCIYFHCAQEGKKIDILTTNNQVWGQAFLDLGYVQGKCDHLFASVHFKGSVEFLEGEEQKRHALKVMIHQLESDSRPVISAQINDKSVERVKIGKIEIEYMSGKASKEVITSL